MRQVVRPPAAVLLLGGLALVLTVIAAACGGSAVPTPLVPTVPTITGLPSIDEMLSEKILGTTAASNTIVEYVSFWSTGSKTFHLGDGALMKSQLADTGRAQIFFRNLFLTSEVQNGPPVAAMLARCAGNAKFFDAVNTIFQNQGSWLNAPSGNPDTAVQQVMLGFGMGQPLINSCVSNSALANGLGQVFTNAEALTYQLPDGTQRAPGTSGLSILSVPAVVVNGVLFDGVNAADGTPNAAFAPTLANIQAFLK